MTGVAGITALTSPTAAIAQTAPRRLRWGFYDPYTNTCHGDGVDDIVHMASLTKLMTGAVEFERLNSPHPPFDPDSGALRIPEIRNDLDDRSRRSLAAFRPRYRGDPRGLHVGDIIPASDLLLGMGAKSCAICSLTLAVSDGEDTQEVMLQRIKHMRFVGEMNNLASRIGMSSTSYHNVIGYTDSGHYSTIRDTAKLCAFLEQTHSELTRHTFGQATFNLDIGGFHRDRHSSAYFVTHTDRMRFAKTAYTGAAGRCEAGSYHHPDWNPVYPVVMGANSKEQRTAWMGRAVGAIDTYVEQQLAMGNQPFGGRGMPSSPDPRRFIESRPIPLHHDFHTPA